MFVLLDFSNLCSTVTKNLLAVPKNPAEVEIYGVHSQGIWRLCLNITTDEEIYGEHLKKSAGCA